MAPGFGSDVFFSTNVRRKTINILFETLFNIGRVFLRSRQRLHDKERLKLLSLAFFFCLNVHEANDENTINFYP